MEALSMEEIETFESLLLKINGGPFQ